MVADVAVAKINFRRTNLSYHIQLVCSILSKTEQPYLLEVVVVVAVKVVIFGVVVVVMMIPVVVI